MNITCRKPQDINSQYHQTWRRAAPASLSHDEHSSTRRRHSCYAWDGWDPGSSSSFSWSSSRRRPPLLPQWNRYLLHQSSWFGCLVCVGAVLDLAFMCSEAVCVFSLLEQRCRCHHGGFPYKSTANKKLRTKSPCFSPRQNSGTLQQHVLPKSKGVHLIAPFCTRPGVLL